MSGILRQSVSTLPPPRAWALVAAAVVLPGCAAKQLALSEAETDKIDVAMEEFEGDYDDEELRLYRIKFISEVAN